MWLESKITGSGKAAVWLELPWRVYASRLSSLVWESPTTDIDRQQKQKLEGLKKGGWEDYFVILTIGEKKVLASNPPSKRSLETFSAACAFKSKKNGKTNTKWQKQKKQKLPEAKQSKKPKKITPKKPKPRNQTSTVETSKP